MEVSSGNITVYQEEHYSCAKFVEDIKERFATSKNVNELLRFNPNLLRGALDAGAAAGALYLTSFAMNPENTLRFGLFAGLTITGGSLLKLFSEFTIANRQITSPKVTTATEAIVKGIEDTLSDLKFAVTCVVGAPFIALAMRSDVIAKYGIVRRLSF